MAASVTLTDTGEPQLYSSPALCRDFAFMQHVLLRLIWSLQRFHPKVKQTLYLLFFFNFGTPMDLSGSAQICDQGNNALFFYYQGRRETGRGFLFFPRSRFPKEMRPIPLSCVWREEVRQSRYEGVPSAQHTTFLRWSLRACSQNLRLRTVRNSLSLLCSWGPAGESLRVWSQSWLKLVGFENITFLTDI